jgi:ASCH domain-containing protein
MKALSVREPWASMIASGQKTIEVRSRRTHYRGPLAICASRGGGAVAVVELVDCRPMTADDDKASGGVWSRFPECRTHFAWTLRLVHRVTSDPIKGRLGFYDVPESALRPARSG